MKVAHAIGKSFTRYLNSPEFGWNYLQCMVWTVMFLALCWWW